MPRKTVVLQQARLRFLPRILQHAPPILLAILHADDKKRAIPWTGVIRTDLQEMWIRSRTCARLPDPQTHPSSWHSFMLSDRWHNAVCDVHSSHSALDKIVTRTSGSSPSPLLSFSCNLCSDGVHHFAFATKKALMSHQRSKHGMKSNARLYADADGICAWCQNCYVTRLRVLRHLTDRRSSCLNKLVSAGSPVLDDARVSYLDNIDRGLRRQAQRAGRAHPVAAGSATKADGKRIGRVCI